MKTVIQRVNHASVAVAGEIRGAIGAGLMVLTGFGPGDNSAKVRALAKKIVELRIFANADRKFDRSLLDTGGGILIVPQFTLYADTSKGRRPEFFQALNPAEAAQLFTEFGAALQELGVKQVAAGVFGAYMQVTLENDGPVTILLEN